MPFYYLALWYLVMNCRNSFADERHDFFNLDNYEATIREWKSPHDDVFAYSVKETEADSSGLPAIDKSTFQEHFEHINDFEACRVRNTRLDKKVRTTGIFVQRFIEHLVRIYDETKKHHEGIISMKLSSEDERILRSFAKDDIFREHSLNNIHDILKKAFTVPSKSSMDKVFTAVNFVVRFLQILWKWTVYCFQEIRFIPMNILFSADFVTYATMVLPSLTFFYALWKGRSAWTALMLAAFAVGFISYFVELRSAIEVARAKDLAKLARSKNVPLECKSQDDLGYYDSTVIWFRRYWDAVDRCEQYYRDQVPGTSIEPSEVFWKILFTPFTVCMDKFGHGLRGFITTFGKDLGWLSKIVILPLGVLALFWFSSLLLCFFSGGCVTLPVMGKISFSNPFGRRYKPVITDAASENPDNNASSTTDSTPAINHFNFHFLHPSHPIPSQITSHSDVNMSISVRSGPTLQLKSGASETKYSMEITGENSGGSTVNVVQQPQLTAARPETNDDLSRISQQPRPLAGLESSQSGSNAPAVLQPSTGTSLSENDHSCSFNSNVVRNHCALTEIGAGDYVQRDLSHQMLPSGMVRWRRHHRNHSL